MRRMQVVLLFFTVLFAYPAGLTTSVALAQSVKLSGVAPKVKKFAAGTVRAYSLSTDAVYGRDLNSKRTYQLNVPAGGYVVLTDVLGKKERASSLTVVSAKKGKSTSRKALSATATASTRISVGNVLLKTPNGKTVKAVNGKDITVDDLLIVDLLNSKNECGFAIAEDRKFGRFKDVLKEIKLQSSKLSADKINFKSAIATLNANAPQFRVSGSVEVNDNQELTGNSNLQITNLETGVVIWEKKFKGGSTNLSNFSEPLAQAVADAICIPQEVAGTFTGVQKIDGSGFSVTYSWTGQAVFKLNSFIPSNPSEPDNLDVALYQYIDGDILSYSVDGKNNGCSVKGQSTLVKPEFPSTGALMVYLNPVSGLGYRYSLAATLLKPDAIEISKICPDNTTVDLDAATAELTVSNSEEDLPSTTSLRRFTGTFTLEKTDMQWDFNSKP